jgi:CDGSH-type Zn-finger protein
MDDAKKAASAARIGTEQDSAKSNAGTSDAFIAYMDDSSDSAVETTKEDLTTAAKALDRWFRERQKTKGAPRLLEVPNEALVSNAGPLQITGNITLVNEDGSIQYANHLSLCRCGSSKSKPTCDDSHLDAEFLHSGKIQEASDAAASDRASKITVSCIENGPITFRGRLRLHNHQGQECVKLRGALCRCGQSAKKPFCDGSHERTGFRTGV